MEASFNVGDHLAGMIADIVSIPPRERMAFYRSMEALCRVRASQLPEATYPLGALAGCWLRLAHICWPGFPPRSGPRGSLR
jgi:hypothetical protein